VLAAFRQPFVLQAVALPSGRDGRAEPEQADPPLA